MDASSEGLQDEGRHSAYALEGSQAIEELEKPEDLISMLAKGTSFDAMVENGITEDQYKAAESTQQSVDFTGNTVVIDPNLINPPRFIESNGKLFVTSMAHPGVSQEVDA